MASSARRRVGQVSIAVAALLFVLTALLVVGARPAAAAANSTVTGRGSTVQFTCPTGIQGPATIDFSASKSKGTAFGAGTISGAIAFKQFNNLSGTINNNSYSLIGTMETDQCGTFLSFLPYRVTLAGQCGTGVVIHYSDTAGEGGDFVGDVSCT